MTNYFRKPDALVDAVRSILSGQPTETQEDIQRKSDVKMVKVTLPDGHMVMRRERPKIEICKGKNESLDPVDQKALKGKHSDRKDKDIDNDGDVDSSDEYLHKRRKAISKAVKNEETELGEAKTDAYHKEMLKARKSTTEETVLEDYSKDLHDYHNDMSDHHYDKSEHHDSAASHHGRNGNQRAQDSHISASKSHDRASNSHYDAAQALKKHGHQSQQYKDAASKAKKHSDIADRSGFGSNRAYPVKESLEDNPANRQHLCAKNVVHESWGEGSCIPTMHADPDEEGNVAWYDVMFDHGIEEQVSIEELKVTKAESHIHSSKKKIKKSKDEYEDDDDDSDEDEKNGKKKKVSGKKDDVDVEPEMDDTKMVTEKEMTPAQEKKREEIVLSMKKEMPRFKKKYGDRAKDVMYATATKIAMREGFELGIEKSDLIEEVELDEAKVTKKMIDDLEDRNEHGMVALKLAQAYGTAAEVKKVQDINKRHNQRGHIERKDQKERDDIIRKYFKMAEEVELDEAKNYEIKNGKIHISKANFRKVHKDYKNSTKGKERMMALDPKSGATTSYEVVFEEVDLDEVISASSAYALVIQQKDGSREIVAKGSKEKMKSAAKKYGGLKQGKVFISLTGKKVGDKILGIGEETELDEAKSGTGYDLYHKDFSSAMQHAYDHAKKKHGITINPKEIDDKVATGPAKPKEGKTNSYRLKGDKGAIQVQVYNKGGSKPFELNMYKEEVELDEVGGAAFGGTIDKIQKVVDDKTAMKIDGVMVDTFTASLIMNIFKKVNKQNQDKMRKMKVTQLANAAYKLSGVKEEVELDEGRGRPRKDGTTGGSEDRENIQMQLRKSVSLRGLKDVEFADGNKVKVPAKVAQGVMSKINSIKDAKQKQNAVQHIAKSHKHMMDFHKGDYKDADAKRQDILKLK